MSGCTRGSLYGDIHLWRGVESPITGTFSNIYVTSKKDFYFGEIGCNTACLSCNGIQSNNCLLCKDYNSSFLFNGTCYPSCPDSAPFTETYTIVENYVKYTGKKCKESCPEGYFPDIDQIT